MPNHHVQAYKTLQELQKAGKIKGIGVSNYAKEDIQELIDDPEIDQIPLVNQKITAFQTSQKIGSCETFSTFQAFYITAP